MDRGTVREVMGEMEAAARQIATRHGLVFVKQHARFNPSEMTTRISLQSAVDAAAQADFRQMQFPILAERLGLPADCLNKTFFHRGVSFTVTGIKIERPRYPVEARRIDGKQFKFPALAVKNGLEYAMSERLSSGAVPAGRDAFNRLS